MNSAERPVKSLKTDVKGSLPDCPKFPVIKSGEQGKEGEGYKGKGGDKGNDPWSVGKGADPWGGSYGGGNWGDGRSGDGGKGKGRDKSDPTMEK